VKSLDAMVSDWGKGIFSFADQEDGDVKLPCSLQAEIHEYLEDENNPANIPTQEIFQVKPDGTYSIRKRPFRKSTAGFHHK